MTKWTEAEVARLERWQKSGSVHPFTCPGGGAKCDDRVLIPTPAGWVCACGGYKQAWVDPVMLAHEPPEPFVA